MAQADGTPAGKAKTNRPKRNFVRATTRTLELTKVGHAVNFKVYQQGRLLGRLEVGLGALRWSPAGRKAAETKTIPWKVFATMIRGWPFGEPVRARLKFEMGHLRWRSPGKKGRGRTMTWDEFVRRMEAPLRTVPPYPPQPTHTKSQTPVRQRTRKPSG